MIIVDPVHVDLTRRASTPREVETPSGVCPRRTSRRVDADLGELALRLRPRALDPPLHNEIVHRSENEVAIEVLPFNHAQKCAGREGRLLPVNEDVELPFGRPRHAVVGERRIQVAYHQRIPVWMPASSFDVDAWRAVRPLRRPYLYCRPAAACRLFMLEGRGWRDKDHYQPKHEQCGDPALQVRHLQATHATSPTGPRWSGRLG
mmetsp:Transcript_30538/g.72671  ORF Transcript_30538/g.72671 Transcript_30538/m.72671 type:complete len:205 (+) Transcript_30538:263-877(+)